MGSYLDKPKTEKICRKGEGNGLRYGLSAMQGWREEMEDAHVAVTGLGEGELSGWSFFGVFDGHGGATVARVAAEKLLNTIMATEEFKRADYIKAIRKGFLEFDKELSQMPNLQSGKDKAGSTAVCVFVSPDHLYIANCGDSRAVLCRGGKAAFASKDHKPAEPSEAERIGKAGGVVFTNRVNGLLAVSRALGDFGYKATTYRSQCEQLVSPEPDVHLMPRDAATDEFILLACDGVWDVLSTDDAVSYVRYLMETTEDVLEVTNQLVDACLYMGSMDNMSAVLVAFSGAPGVSESALAAEQELEERLRAAAAEVVSTDPSVDFLKLLWGLGKEGAVVGLPPGAGLSAKRRLLESIFRELCPNNQASIDEVVTFQAQMTRIFGLPEPGDHPQLLIPPTSPPEHPDQPPRESN